MPKLVSVIIATYNRAETVARCVESIFASDYAPLEVVVVNDCSPDNTEALLREKFGSDARFALYSNAENMLSSASQNKGAALAHGEYFFFLDDDNILPPTSIGELVRALDAHGEYGLMAPVSVHRTGAQKGYIWTLGSDFNRWTSQPADYLPPTLFEEFRAEREIYPTTCSPNAFMVRRDAWEKVGGKDESFGIMFEESDLGWRICAAGWKAGICAAARADHYSAVEEGCAPQLRHLGIEKPKRAYAFGRNRLLFARRHFSRAQYLSVLLIFAPLSALYYGFVALKNRRADIALAYLKGTLAGAFAKKEKVKK